MMISSFWHPILLVVVWAFVVLAVYQACYCTECFLLRREAFKKCDFVLRLRQMKLSHGQLLALARLRRHRHRTD